MRKGSVVPRTHRCPIVWAEVQLLPAYSPNLLERAWPHVGIERDIISNFKKDRTGIRVLKEASGGLVLVFVARRP